MEASFRVQPLTIQCAKITSTCMIITIFQDDYHLTFSNSDLFVRKRRQIVHKRLDFARFCVFYLSFQRRYCVCGSHVV